MYVYICTYTYICLFSLLENKRTPCSKVDKSMLTRVIKVILVPNMNTLKLITFHAYNAYTCASVRVYAYVFIFMIVSLIITNYTTYFVMFLLLLAVNCCIISGFVSRFATHALTCARKINMYTRYLHIYIHTTPSRITR